MFFLILIVVLSLLGLIALHELGHFFLAKKFGVKVEEFGLGIPPRIFGKRFGETIYSLNLLPIGAFVRLYGEEKAIKDPRSFTGKPIWQRSLIILGGVLSFWLVAVVLLSVVFAVGAPQAISDDEPGPLVNPKVQILAVSPNSPAEGAGLKTGDTLLGIDKVKEVQGLTEANKGKEITFTVQRGQEVFEISLTPRTAPPEGEGAMGVALVRTAEKSFPLWQAPLKGAEATFYLTYAIVIGWAEVLTSLVQGQGMPQGAQVVGPVGIGSLAGQAAQAGLSYFLNFIAMIAVYLAVLNILPIPSLDGGKLLFLGIEKIKGSPLNQRVEQGVTAAFFFVLITLILFLTVKDVIRLF